MPYLLLLVLLTACATQEPAPTFDINPWVLADLPFRVQISDDMDQADIDAARAGVDTINKAAGAQLLTVVGNHPDIWVSYGDTTAVGWSHCEDVCFVDLNETKMVRQTSSVRNATLVHEYMHMLGYTAEDGSIHDHGDSLMFTSIRDTHLSARHVAYLREMAKSY